MSLSLGCYKDSISETNVCALVRRYVFVRL